MSIVSLAILFFFSEQEAEETQSKEVKKAVVEVDTKDLFYSDQYEFVLPRPFASIVNFKEAGMKFDKEQMNPVEKIAASLRSTFVEYEISNRRSNDSGAVIMMLGYSK